MTAFLPSRSPRERRWLGAALYVVICAGLYVAVTEPAALRRERTLAQLHDAREALDYVVAAGRTADGLRAQQTTVNRLPRDETLMSLLDRTAAHAGIAAVIKRIVPAGERGANIVFEAVEFDQLISWLAQLDADYGISVTQLSADAAARPGRTNVSAVLTAP
jgi:general secretion pathway protein M